MKWLGKCLTIESEWKCVFTSYLCQMIRTQWLGEAAAAVIVSWICVLCTKHMPWEIIISIYVHVYMFFTEPKNRLNSTNETRAHKRTHAGYSGTFENSHCTRSFSCNVIIRFALYCVCVCSMRSLCKWAYVAKTERPLRCTSHQRIVRIARFPFISITLQCIGTLLTQLIRTYAQLISFLRVANQLQPTYLTNRWKRTQ